MSNVCIFKHVINSRLLFCILIIMKKKILFIENRGRTYFWNIMADLLERDGHDVFFIVENHIFSPHKQNVYKVPYPSKKDLKDTCEYVVFEKIKRSDRAINHFKLTSSNHYGYYYTKIKTFIEGIKPDVVFGESTAFHELLTIEICRELGILYLNPSSCRYPAGRFSFYKYDTLEPYSGSGEELTVDEATQMINGIVRRNVVPDYMKKVKVNFSTRYMRFKELLKLTWAYYQGEHYASPSFFVKYNLENRKKQNIARWNALADKQRGKIDSVVFKILYPLQMQPESNLDVWGRKYCDQLQIIKNIIQATDEKVCLVIKPNPKSKYELSSDLIDFVEATKRIVLVHHDVPMGKVFPMVDMVITVTGTIAMECVWANKPVVTLVKTLHNSAKNAIFLENIDDLQSYVDLVQKNGFPTIDDKEKVEFINLINQTSFAGIPEIEGNSGENVKLCKVAFEKILHD